MKINDSRETDTDKREGHKRALGNKTERKEGLCTPGSNVGVSPNRKPLTFAGCFAHENSPDISKKRNKTRLHVHFSPSPIPSRGLLQKFCGETFSVCSQMKNHSPANDLPICRFTLYKTCITKYLCSPDTFLNRITPYFIFLGNSKN